jgi:hypothetical protein
MTAATLVLLSPPCGSTAVWSRVVPFLDELGAPSVAVQLPSCLPESDVDDASFARSVLDEHAEPLVLVGHSGAGAVLTEVGAHPSVRHLVFLDAAMWDVGESWDLVYKGGVEEAFGRCVRPRSGYTEFDSEALAEYFVSRGWSADDAEEFVPGLRPQRHEGAVYTPTQAAWRTVPSTFIQASNSEMKRHAQEHFAARATDVIQIEGDHFPHWRRPREVAEIFARIAHQVVAL